MLLCAAAFTSCSEDFDDWASPQSNGQGDPAATYGITVTAGEQANVVMNDNTPETIKLVNVIANQPDIAKLQLQSLIINGSTLPATFDEETGTVIVNAAQLDSLIEASTLDRSATIHEFTATSNFVATLASGESVQVAGESQASVTPYANTPEKDPNGYVMLGQWQDWNLNDPTWMTEVEPGIYQAMVITTVQENWFKFYNATPFMGDTPDWSVCDANAYGVEVNGDTSPQNLLVWPNDPRYGSLNTIMIEGAGMWLVTLDMNKFSFTYEPKETVYYSVGTPNGWKDNRMHCPLYGLGGNQYSYTTYWPNQWATKIWDKDNFGNWDAAFGSTVNGSTDESGSLINSNSQAFGPSEGGAWATLTINMATKQYEWTIISEPTTSYTSVSLIGSWDWSTDIDMVELANNESEQLSSYSAPHNWYVRHTFNSDVELKFRANHDWTTSWGCSEKGTAVSEDIYYAAPGSENIIVPAGTYDFYLNDITGNWNIIKVTE